MAVPVVKGVKSANERFAGALNTYTIEAMMQDGNCLLYTSSCSSDSLSDGAGFRSSFLVCFCGQIWQPACPVSYTHLDVYKRQTPDSVAPNDPTMDTTLMI